MTDHKEKHSGSRKSSRPPKSEVNVVDDQEVAHIASAERARKITVGTPPPEAHPVSQLQRMIGNHALHGLLMRGQLPYTHHAIFGLQSVLGNQRVQTLRMKPAVAAPDSPVASYTTESMPTSALIFTLKSIFAKPVGKRTRADKALLKEYLAELPKRVDLTTMNGVEINTLRKQLSSLPSKTVGKLFVSLQTQLETKLPFVKSIQDGKLSFEEMAAWRELIEWSMFRGSKVMDELRVRQQALGTALVAQGAALGASIEGNINTTLSSMVSDADREKASEANVERLFSALPAGLKANESFPTTYRDRVEFLEVMALYFGSYENVIKHYMQIRRANVPGTLYLHDDAATALESVSTALNGLIPKTTTGLGLRSRWKVSPNQSHGKMSHPFGYAIDYRAIQNPHLHGDKDRLTLLNLYASDDPKLRSDHPAGAMQHIHVDMPGDSKKAITQMGNTPASSENVENFSRQLESEINRMGAISNRFRQVLTAEAQDALYGLQTKFKPILKRENENTKAMNALKPKLKKAEAKLTQQQNGLNTLTKRAEALQNAKKPQPDQLKKLERLIEQAKARVTEAQAQLDALIEQENDLKTARGAIEDEKNDIRTKMKPHLKPFFDRIDAEIKRLKKSGPPTPADNEQIEALNKLQTRLENDIAFVIGTKQATRGDIDWRKREVDNPPILQMADLGFFNPEQRPTNSDDLNNEGFDSKFMVEMAKHGFMQGIFWNSELDSMHFDFRKGLDAIPAVSSREPARQRLALLFGEGAYQKPKEKRRR